MTQHFVSEKILKLTGTATFTDINNCVQNSNALNLKVNSKSNVILTFAMQSGDPNDGPSVLLDDNISEEVDNCKFLGIFMDQELTWNTHIDHVYSKLASGIYIKIRWPTWAYRKWAYTSKVRRRARPGSLRLYRSASAHCQMYPTIGLARGTPNPAYDHHPSGLSRDVDSASGRGPDNITSSRAAKCMQSNGALVLSGLDHLAVDSLLK
ncbi:hypothetical protein J6590_041137 [Homalodisca vitripennis]|nr:hypothetical protein J6590_041137 [Homalodisca vitripennis]